ncbi:MAG TPA: S8 family serine peptidase, partial [Thermoanaerobaculia bacterium]
PAPPVAAGDLAGARVMVTLFDGPPQRWQRTLADLQGMYDLQPVSLWPIESLGLPCVLLEVSDGDDPAAVAERLASDPRVESAQPVYRFEVLAEAYDDPYAQLQHAARDLRVSAAHRRATGKGVRVAVVDTGVDFSHPDLVERVVGVRDFVSRESRGTGAFTADVHGTGVAGVIAASANNGVGIVGVAPEAEVLAVKACWPSPEDARKASCDSYTLAQGLDFSIDQGARVINLSLTGPRDPILARLITAALGRGISVVAATARPGAPGFPASEEGVLAIGTAPTDSLPGLEGSPLTAPGVDILTTVPREGYDFLSGSSLAAAHVTGVVALLLELAPGLQPAAVADLLARTAHPSNPHGAVVVDACAALAEAVGEPADELCAAE